MGKRKHSDILDTHPTTVPTVPAAVPTDPAAPAVPPPAAPKKRKTQAKKAVPVIDLASFDVEVLGQPRKHSQVNWVKNRHWTHTLFTFTDSNASRKLRSASTGVRRGNWRSRTRVEASSGTSALVRAGTRDAARRVGTWRFRTVNRQRGGFVFEANHRRDLVRLGVEQG
ncbi:hypothetical protein B0H17DRAFT_1146380 [Mycena rosella]|uniref:Uncharacterized protein n=1 Tax=Mycena rosella TaxID=1033263 RepID=A0AAD7G4Y5_MYCRO|nr:hypothetical protein B0H17DRAFT_1146380 [Mycena rosella]